ncbi:MAG: choice-of-anchor C family protein [Candidatus Limnocylindrales bacterium]
MKRRSMVGASLAVVASLALAGSALAAGFTNGGFANPNDYSVGSYVTLGAGYGSATAIPGWTVTSGNIDWIGSLWQSADGDGYSLDMSGFEPGAISQTFDTMPNATYFVSFSLSGNPYASTDPSLTSPSDKTLTVSATGAAPGYYAYNTSTAGNSTSDMKWATEGYSFVATSSSTTLTFTSTTAGAFGPALDNVTVTQEATATGAQCKAGGWKTMYDANGNLFTNQGQCVSYFATSGAVPIGN